MTRKRHYLSYRWKIFMPMLVGLWIFIPALAVWQSYRETEIRRSYVDAQLEMVNRRVIDELEQSREELATDFLNFVHQYYRDSPNLSDIRVTIYDKNWDVIQSMGPTIMLNKPEQAEVIGGIVERDARVASLRGQPFIFRGSKASDGSYYVVSAVPVNDNMKKALEGGRTAIWAVILGIALLMSVAIYYSSRYLAKGLSLLRRYAERAASDPDFIPGTGFQNDEIGEIANQIITIYNERTKAKKRLDHEHQVALKAIEEKALQKRQLTNNINHELKTPIGVIKGYLDTICDTDDLDPEVREHFIVKARDYANRLAVLISDVSAITRLAEGGNMINTENIDFHDFSFQFAKEIKESGVLGHMEFIADIPDGTEVRGNIGLLNGMLMNLARNSANYSCGTTCILECIGLTDDGTMYEFSFYDDGVGVPEDSLPHLFERFYRVDTGRSRKNGGSGLGLSLVYNTITALGGTIRCLNREDAGLEFRFTLPRASRRK